MLGKIERRDAERVAAAVASAPPPPPPERPPTAELACVQAAVQLRPQTADVRRALHGRVATERPTTAAVRPAAAAGPSAADGWAATQDYETAVHPQGTNLELLLMSTWGDAHYLVSAAARPPPPASPPPPPARRCQPAAVPRRRSHARGARAQGLNGIEILDPSGAPIRLRVDQLRARPHSVNDLPEVKGDPRTPDKLVDGVNDTYDDAHMWLAPFARGSNLLSISLTSVQRGGQRIGALRLWNYAKTAARGVRHFAVYIDGALLYQGSLRPAPPRPTGLRADGSSDASFVQTVLFTDNQALIEQERANVYTKEELEEETVLVDNGTRIGGSLTEGGNCRPTTAAVGSGGRPPPAVGSRGPR